MYVLVLGKKKKVSVVQKCPKQLMMGSSVVYSDDEIKLQNGKVKVNRVARAAPVFARIC